MSLSERNSVVFAYESSVHSVNVLLSLDEQRKQDLFCDVTILVEDQRFRAHRSVLAACSSYFHSRIVGQLEPDLRVILPEEVTLKGFDPLLQFAYTSKLILNKDNVAEVCKCAEFLGIHDIEESCFQFLKFKFLDHKPGWQEYQKKKCCKSRCRKEDHKIEVADNEDLEINDGDENLQNECIQNTQLRACKGEQNSEVSVPQDSASQTCESVSERSHVFGSASLCPKYRKFQKALESDKVPVMESSSSIKEVQVTSAASIHQTESISTGAIQKSLECAAVQPISKCEDAQEEMEEDGKEETTSVFQSIETKSNSVFDPHNSSIATHGLYSASLLNVYNQYCDLTTSSMPSNTDAAGKNCIVVGAGNCKPVSESTDGGLSLKSRLCDRENVNNSSPSSRSSVEREIAEQLAKGFWSDVYTDTECPVNLSPSSTKEFSEQIYSEKKAECPWLGIRISDSPEHYPPRTFTTLSSVNCPFINNLSTENSSEINSGDCVPEQQPEQCHSYVISLEEDSETDTEGDSESYSAREQECEVKLPFNAQKIISLSRNDFQAFLKMHKLTPEQLDCVHDIRRRSKNRIAAQRCRKRKLDCIQNLESEIEKLQNEKDNLLKEKDHILSTLVETKQNLTGLCQQVCKEAALSHEQIQILAKYSTSDCPLSFLVPEREQPAPSDVMSAIPLCVELSAGLSLASANEQSSSYQRVKGACGAGYDQAQESCPVPVRISEKTLCLEQCAQSGSGITDFCRQMTDKCTTDE
ncbi:transcription regulator protein BACH1 [Hemicordylus capensis]|uniref:transcription regulator protein BACH1 n=1 Tax=Hemicordylus capensis TaxID=884348 RepID=UPI002304083D|nr:transcription regulator protein BACH1 [Hemicordylus capensis]XP_053165307.1 transcription regulator protein BACH1 [Hemicordylus capensis]XP_053165308.1 transcription regulator protein BACH1 [Hemicordylus capensis]XP_053165310.1 transcription regulator protein BACH1 [Hemicordylus capensis]XP_053165311.1 transcription regulator protein BACH1 [Hemicordylus capensis]XP_053165312.1 transcription regulator protein BACH1 [Hemicordylus capensis]XP_053165313.1 transcription regulator protein BACH1 